MLKCHAYKCRLDDLLFPSANPGPGLKSSEWSADESPTNLAAPHSEKHFSGSFVHL